jgi:hypothetical protein
MLQVLSLWFMFNLAVFVCLMKERRDEDEEGG